MRALLALLAVGCAPEPLSPELRAEVTERDARVLECLDNLGAVKPSRSELPEVRIDSTCYFDAPGRHGWVKGYTDHRDYVRVGSDLSALEHELAAYHSGTHSHGEGELTHICGDMLSREWRKEHGALPCEDNRP